METPKKKDLIKELLDIIDHKDTSDFECLAALKVLKKYDKDAALKKALSMKEEGKKRVPVIDMLLSLSHDEKKDSMAMIPIEELNE